MKIIITKKGKLLLAKMVGQKACLSDMALGKGEIHALSENITGMVAQVIKKPIESFSLNKDTNEVNLRTIFTNEKLAEGFQVREIGIYGIDPDEGEILFAYGNALQENCDYFEPGAGNVILKEIISIILKFGDAPNIQITVDPSVALVTMEEFTNGMSAVEEDIVGAINGVALLQEMKAGKTDLENLEIGMQQELDKKVSQTDLEALATATSNSLAGKVGKVEGKGLSSNDYTSAEKEKLAGIEAGANKTTVVDSLTNTSTAAALSAAQGKALDGRIGAKVVITADSTSPPTDTSVLWVHGGDA